MLVLHVIAVVVKYHSLLFPGNFPCFWLKRTSAIKFEFSGPKGVRYSEVLLYLFSGQQVEGKGWRALLGWIEARQEQGVREQDEVV